MKKLYYVLFFLVILAFSCTKDDMLNTGQGIDQLSSNAALKASNLVIKVYPNNTDDTQNLIDAFAQAKASGKNVVVKLMPGTFNIGLLEVTEFYGTLTGSGKGKTIITNLPDLPTPLERMQQNLKEALITFIRGDVVVSDLSVELSELDWVVDPENYQEMLILLFSDYWASDIPAIRHIKVNLNNIEIIGLDRPDVSFHGIVFQPANAPYLELPVPRSNIDATVTNCEFSKLNEGFFVWGCKSGSFIFSSNIFNKAANAVHENIGVTVKIMKNIFIKTGMDLNTWEQGILEYTPSKVGTYEIRDNIFNIDIGRGAFGLWDNWRYDHPDNPDWMRMIWDNNTFNILGDESWVGKMYGLKNAIFSNNKIVGDAQDGHLGVYGSWCENGCPMWSEGCQFLNNLFLQKNFHIELSQKTMNCLIKGNLKNVTIEDYGFNNKVVGKTN
jgi:hypothetical protein